MRSIRVGARWNVHLLWVAALIAVSAGCRPVTLGGDLSVTIAPPRGLSAGEYWSPGVTGAVAPGGTYHVRLSGRLHQPRDILVEFHDRTGSYAESRITLAAGDFYDQRIAITLPVAVRDPDSAFFSFKVVPVQGSWRQFLDEIIVQVIWLAPRRVAAPLFFAGDVDAWEYSFTRNYSNHDGWTVRVGKASDGPFNGTDTIAVRYFGMTGDSDDYQLNLATGELYYLQTPPAYPGLSPVEKRHAFPRAEEEKAEWLKLLNELTHSVDYVLDSQGQGSQPFLEYPSLKNTSDYLHRLVESVEQK